MDNEVKGSGNSYTTEFRQLDPRLGRWLSLDPVIQPWQSPYCSMDNNPIWYNDVFGNVIDEKKGKGVTNRQFRQFKRNIRRLIKHSETFRSMYNDMKNSTETFHLQASISNNASSTTSGLTTPNWQSSDGSTTIDIYVDKVDKKDYLSTIAHEVGHGWRFLHVLDVKPKTLEMPVAPQRDFSQSVEDRENDMKDYYRTKDYVTGENLKNATTARKQAELGALDIQNIVVHELTVKHPFKYRKLSLNYIYFNGTVTEPYTTDRGNPSYQIAFENYMLSRTKADYDKGVKIYEELKVSPILENKK